MRRFLAVGLALLIVLSGCNTAPGAPNESHGNDEVVQSVTDANRSDIDALYDRHQRALRNSSSYRLTRAHHENGTAYRRTELRVNRTSERVVHRERRSVDSTKRFQTSFVNRSGMYTRIRANDSHSHEYRVRTGSSYGFSGTDEWAAEVQLPLPSVVAGYDFEYRGRENGAYVFEADALRSSSGDTGEPSDRENVTDASARLVVDDRGRILRYSSSVKLDRNGTVTTMAFDFEATDVGRTTVSIPEWVQDASASNSHAAEPRPAHQETT